MHDPWGSVSNATATSSSTANVGSSWADFSSASFEANFNEAFSGGDDEKTLTAKIPPETDVNVKNVESTMDVTSSSKEVENVENIAQDVVQQVENVKEAAGDQEKPSGSGDDSIVAEKIDNKAAVEPSK